MIAYNEQELVYLYHLGSSIAYELFLDEYRVKVLAIVRRYYSDVLFDDDYCQEAIIALAKAIEKYRYDMNTSTYTYFSYIIQDALRTKQRMLHRKIRYLDTKQKISFDQNIYGTQVKVENIIADEKVTYRPDYQLYLRDSNQKYNAVVDTTASLLEKEIVGYIQQGYKSREIARIMNIDVKKVYNAKYRLQKKIGKVK